MKGWCQARDWEINASEGTVKENIDNSFKSLNCKEEKKRRRKKGNIRRSCTLQGDFIDIIVSLFIV